MGRWRKRRIRRAEDQVDRITELPVEVRAHILDYLSVADAIATSVLSRQWRSTWTGLTLNYLRFDEDFMERASKDPHPNKVIDKVLALHSGPIQHFFLSIPSPKIMKLEGVFALLRVLANRGVKVIEIDGLDYSCDLPGSDWFSIPSSLFECRELEELMLDSCEVKVPKDFKGFPNLVNIKFDSVSIERNDLEDLISKCPVLEHLTIEESDFGEFFVLKAPNLKSLKIDYMWSWIDVDFQDVRKLSRVSLLATESDYKIDFLDQSCSWIKWLPPLSGIEDLTFDCHLLRVM